MRIVERILAEGVVSLIHELIRVVMNCGCDICKEVTKQLMSLSSPKIFLRPHLTWTICLLVHCAAGRLHAAVLRLTHVIVRLRTESWRSGTLCRCRSLLQLNGNNPFSVRRRGRLLLLRCRRRRRIRFVLHVVLDRHRALLRLLLLIDDPRRLLLLLPHQFLVFLGIECEGIVRLRMFDRSMMLRRLLHRFLVFLGIEAEAVVRLIPVHPLGRLLSWSVSRLHPVRSLLVDQVRLCVVVHVLGFHWRDVQCAQLR